MFCIVARPYFGRRPNIGAKCSLRPAVRLHSEHPHRHGQFIGLIIEVFGGRRRLLDQRCVLRRP